MAKVAKIAQKNTNPRGSIPGVQLEPNRLTLHPTRSNRCGCYQYGQVLQTSLSQAPPQVPYHIYDDTQDRKVFTVTRCSRSDVVFD